MYSHCVNPYFLCTPSVRLAPALPVITLICSLFQCFLSCTQCISVDAPLLFSLLAVFMSCNVQDKHNRRGYNVGNLEISMMVVFSFQFSCTVSTVRARENTGTQQALKENGPSSAEWTMLTIHFNRASRIQTLFMNIHMKQSCLTWLLHLSSGNTSVLMCCSYDYLQDMNFKPDCSDRDGNPI